jgi:hypothetical protein
MSWLEPTNLLLLACALVYGLIGEWVDGGILLLFVVGISLLDALQQQRSNHALAELARLSALIGPRPSWVMASTHPGDELLAATAHKSVASAHPGLLSIIVPRHPDRGPALAAELAFVERQQRRLARAADLGPGRVHHQDPALPEQHRHAVVEEDLQQRGGVDAVGEAQKRHRAGGL